MNSKKKYMKDSKNTKKDSKKKHIKNIKIFLKKKKKGIEKDLGKISESF